MSRSVRPVNIGESVPINSVGILGPRPGVPPSMASYPVEHRSWPPLRVSAMASRPVGGVLSSASRRLGDHPSVRPTSGLPLPGERRTGRPYPTFGLAPSGVCRATRVTPGAGALLPHRFTLTCARRAGHRRSVLCGTFLRVAPTGCKPAPCPVEPRPSSARSSRRTPNRGHPADSPSRGQVCHGTRR